MELMGGFEVSIQSQDVIEENARERFGPYGDPFDTLKAVNGGWVDPRGSGKITPKGWDQLNKDIEALEKNSMKWLKRSFNSAHDDGHDSNGSLVGRFWFNPLDMIQIDLVHIGIHERIDMTDLSYGDLADSVWEGVSDLGTFVLDGAIYFQLDPTTKDEVEEIIGRWQTQYRQRVPRTGHYKTRAVYYKGQIIKK